MSFLGASNPVLTGYRSPHSCYFDGTTRLARGADVTGLSDSSTGVCSIWLSIDFSATLKSIFTTTGWYLRRNATNAFELGMGDVGYVSGFSMLTSTYAAQHPDFMHILATWDCSSGTPATRTAASRIYINDVRDNASEAFNYGVGFAADFGSANNWLIGSAPSGAELWVGMITEIWFASGLNPNLDDPAIRRKFIDERKRPVDLGGFGEKPFGTQPAMYFKGDSNYLTKNLGSGGDFSVAAGTLINTTLTPSYRRNA